MKYRHRVLGLLILLFAIVYLDRVCISVAGPRIQDDLHIDPIGWSWVTAMFTRRCPVIPGTAAGSLDPSHGLSGKLHLPKRQLHAVSGTNAVLHERFVWRGSVATAGRLRTSSDLRGVRRRYRTRIPEQIHSVSSGPG